MKLTKRLCKYFHCPAYWTSQTSHNKKVAGKTYEPAFWCSKCKKFRYLMFLWCKSCGIYMAREHEHTTIYTEAASTQTPGTFEDKHNG